MECMLRTGRPAPASCRSRPCVSTRPSRTPTRGACAAGWRNWGSPEVPVTSQVTGTLQALRIFEAIEDPNAERVRSLLAGLG